LWSKIQQQIASISGQPAEIADDQTLLAWERRA
jgi:hypothetical protein